MEKFAPSYFNDFSCLNSECRHSCCIGWEIALDKKTYKRLLDSSSAYKFHVLDNLVSESGTHVIKLCDNGRCPFLNERNLCDVIINLGEKYTSEICREHPRFYNRIGSRVEAGLGLCCEACADIILNKGWDFSLIRLSKSQNAAKLTDKESELIELRDSIISAIKTSNSFDDAVTSTLGYIGVNQKALDLPTFLDYLSDAEYLEQEWCDIINFAKRARVRVSLEDNKLKALLIYFIYRHFCNQSGEKERKAALLFAILSTMAIERISAYYLNVPSPATQAARLYSTNIEYSSENTETLINLIMINGEING